MTLLSRFFSVLETRMIPPRLCLWRTVYLNFRVLSFSQAIKLPIFIYGKVRFPNLAGYVEFKDCEVKRGMIKIGKQDPFSVNSGQGFIGIAPKGKIIFHGPANISTNVSLRILGSGELNIGKFILLGSGVKIICNGGIITIGDYTRIAFNTNIINSSFHSIIELDTGKICNHIRPIKIGEKTWIGNNSSIAGGSRLKSATIVGAGSFVNKDFTKLEQENQLIGGRPAKLIKSGYRRIFNPNMEEKIIRYFMENPNDTTLIVEDFEDDMHEIEKEFK